MAGFFEFALMRTRGDIDQKYLSELYYQYMNVEEDFVRIFSTQPRRSWDVYSSRNRFSVMRI